MSLSQWSEDADTAACQRMVDSRSQGTLVYSFASLLLVTDAMGKKTPQMWGTPPFNSQPVFENKAGIWEVQGQGVDLLTSVEE